MPDNDTAYNGKGGNVVFGDVKFDLQASWMNNRGGR